MSTQVYAKLTSLLLEHFKELGELYLHLSLVALY